MKHVAPTRRGHSPSRGGIGDRCSSSEIGRVVRRRGMVGPLSNGHGRLLIASGDGVLYFNGTETQLSTLPADLAPLVTGTLTVITLQI